MYFISRNNQKEGPHTLEEVLAMRLTDDMLVWKEGDINWSKVSELPELAHVVIKTPPPLPSERATNQSIERKSERYKKGKEIIIRNAIWGVVVAVVLDLILATYCESGGSNEFPIFRAPGRETFSDFLIGLFPYSLLISEVIVIIIGFIEIGLSETNDKTTVTHASEEKTIKHYETDKGTIVIYQQCEESVSRGDKVMMYSYYGNAVAIDGKYVFQKGKHVYFHIIVEEGKVKSFSHLDW